MNIKLSIKTNREVLQLDVKEKLALQKRRIIVVVVGPTLLFNSKTESSLSAASPDILRWIPIDLTPETPNRGRVSRFSFYACVTDIPGAKATTRDPPSSSFYYLETRHLWQPDAVTMANAISMTTDSRRRRCRRRRNSQSYIGLSPVMHGRSVRRREIEVEGLEASQ